MLLTALGLTCGCVVIGSATNIVTLCAGRGVTGLFTGIISLVVPLYIPEVSRPAVHGFLGSGIQLSVTIGISGVLLIGKYVNWSALAFVSILQAAS